MRWLTLVVLALAPSLARAQEGDAEKLYRAMEKKILAAKSLALEFNDEVTFENKSSKVQGSIHIDAGNKIRFEATGSGPAVPFSKILMLTNGDSVYEKSGDMIIANPEPRKSKPVLGIIARQGAITALLEKKLHLQLEKDVPAKNFKLGVKQMVGKRQAQVVHYEIDDPQYKVTHAYADWIDTDTQLPLKRTYVVKAPNGSILRSTETYSVFTLDAKLDGKLFEIPNPKGASSQVPEGWRQVKGTDEHYSIAVDRDVKHGGKASCTVKSKVDEPEAAGILIQVFRADDYQGKRLRVTAFVKAKDVTGWAGLWVRVDGKEKASLAFDNMMDRPIKGTSDWKEFQIVLDVPDHAEDIYFGFLMTGAGQTWVDDFQLTAVGKDVKTTGMPREGRERKHELLKDLPKAPKNLDFER